MWPQSIWLCNLGHGEKDTLQERKVIWRDRRAFSSNIRWSDRLTKKFMNNSIDQWFMRLEKVVEEGGGHIVQLISGTDTAFQRGYSNWLGSKVYFH